MINIEHLSTGIYFLVAQIDKISPLPSTTNSEFHQKNTEEEMQDQYTEMKHRLEEKESVIKDLNSELLTISGELENVQQRLAVLSQENEVLEGNLQANQVNYLSLSFFFFIPI